MKRGYVGKNRALEEVLHNAGLPTDPCLIIGRIYTFGKEMETDLPKLIGTIEAIEISKEGILELYVSNPTFRGKRLNSISPYDGKWVAGVDGSEDAVTRLLLEGESVDPFEGELHLI